MSKIHYRYDPDTMSYRKIEGRFYNTRRLLAITFQCLIFCFGLVYYIIYMQHEKYVDKEIESTIYKTILLNEEIANNVHGFLSHLDIVLESSNKLINDNIRFLKYQNRTIKKNQEEADKKLKETTNTYVALSNEYQRLDYTYDLLNIESSITEEQLKARDYRKKMEGYRDALMFFFLGIITNLLINSFKKKKMIKEQKKILNQDWKKINQDMVDLNELLRKKNYEIEKLTIQLKHATGI